MGVPASPPLLEGVITDRLACRAVDPELFFPPSYTGNYRRQVAAAKALCRSCSGRQRCLDFAIGTQQVHGIWGGATPDERQRSG